MSRSRHMIENHVPAIVIAFSLLFLAVFTITNVITSNNNHPIPFLLWFTLALGTIVMLGVLFELLTKVFPESVSRQELLNDAANRCPDFRSALDRYKAEHGTRLASNNPPTYLERKSWFGESLGAYHDANKYAPLRTLGVLSVRVAALLVVFVAATTNAIILFPHKIANGLDDPNSLSTSFHFCIANITLVGANQNPTGPPGVILTTIMYITGVTLLVGLFSFQVNNVYRLYGSIEAELRDLILEEPYKV